MAILSGLVAVGQRQLWFVAKIHLRALVDMQVDLEQVGTLEHLEEELEYILKVGPASSVVSLALVATTSSVVNLASLAAAS